MGQQTLEKGEFHLKLDYNLLSLLDLQLHRFVTFTFNTCLQQCNSFEFMHSKYHVLSINMFITQLYSHSPLCHNSSLHYIVSLVNLINNDWACCGRIELLPIRH